MILLPGGNYFGGYKYHITPGQGAARARELTGYKFGVVGRPKQGAATRGVWSLLFSCRGMRAGFF